MANQPNSSSLLTHLHQPFDQALQSENSPTKLRLTGGLGAANNSKDPVTTNAAGMNMMVQMHNVSNSAALATHQRRSSSLVAINESQMQQLRED